MFQIKFGEIFLQAKDVGNNYTICMQYKNHTQSSMEGKAIELA